MTEAVVSSTMDPAVKLMWLDALRSGEFKQATGRLVVLEPDTHEPVGYCCLGVLCELAVREGVIDPGDKADEYDQLLNDPDVTVNAEDVNRLVYGDPAIGTHDAMSATELPEAVRLWAGLDKHTPDVLVPRSDDEIADDRRCGIPDSNIEKTRPTPVAELNDDEGWDFLQLADAIERDL